MYCTSCGTALAENLKYCKRCGANLVTTKEIEAVNLLEKRIDHGMEVLFWTAMFGLAVILGGMALMKKIQFDRSLIIAYMVLSSSAFIALFGLGVAQVRRLTGSSKEAIGLALLERTDVNEIDPAAVRTVLEAAPSITEHTTRGLERIRNDRLR
jgi:hypothetical protein